MYPEDKPVEEGDTIEVDVTDTGDQGDGIAKTEEGFVIIVEGKTPEWSGEVRITQVGGTYAFAEPV